MTLDSIYLYYLSVLFVALNRIRGANPYYYLINLNHRTTLLICNSICQLII